jgi:hypothetical protein
VQSLFDAYTKKGLYDRNVWVKCCKPLLDAKDISLDITMKEMNSEFSQYYLSITIIMSKCKYIICGSGNCSIWIMLYRENNKNVYQNNNGKWYCSEQIQKKNKNKNRKK